ncbi:MAG: DEAD/DEAH box helicase [Candidatus Babeliales bacterium]
MNTFKTFNLHPDLIATLETLGITTPTEIQTQTLPILLSQNKDFHGQAQTGTGKTLAFGLPLLSNIKADNKKTQALVVAPTRELVVQIFQSLQPLAQARGISIAAIYGGVSIENQFRDLKKGVQVVIGTPGRLNDHLKRKSLSLSTIQTLVLDEADIMLDMGFREEIDEILQFTPQDRNIWLFSATVKSGISELMKTHMKDPASVRASQKNVGNSNTKQYFCTVPKKYRFEALLRFITNTPSFYGFIFCQTKIETAELAEKLAAKGLSSNALHGDMNQANRNRVIKDFKNKKFSVLVATDVAARGIDVADITHVINYQLPEDHESYVHRVGRTGRAGKEGTAITLINPREVHTIKTLQKRFGVAIEAIEVPSVEAMYDRQIQEAHSFVESMQSTTTKKSHLEKLQALLKNYSTAQINTVILSLLDEKFFKNIDDTPVNFSAAVEVDNRYHNADVGEIMINVGSQDGIQTQDILHYLLQDKSLNKRNIGKIRVIKKRSFVKIPHEKVNDIITALKGKTIRGRRVYIAAVTQ